MGQSPGATGPFGWSSFFSKTLSILYTLIKMEENYETLRMPELRALAREHELRGYSRLRKAELIAFLQNSEQRRPPRTEPEDQDKDEP